MRSQSLWGSTVLMQESAKILVSWYLQFNGKSPNCNDSCPHRYYISPSISSYMKIKSMHWCVANYQPKLKI